MPPALRSAIRRRGRPDEQEAETFAWRFGDIESADSGQLFEVHREYERKLVIEADDRWGRFHCVSGQSIRPSLANGQVATAARSTARRHAIEREATL